MDKRFRKQVIIAIIFGIILILIGYLFHLLSKPAPTCFDGIKNQGEEEIDCGGPCPPCEIKRLSPIKIYWSKFVYTQGQFYYDLVTKIENPNPKYGTGNLPYEFKLFNQKGEEVANYEGSTYILPSQTKYVIKTKLFSPEKAKKIEFKIKDFQWQQLKKDFKKPYLLIRNKKYYSENIENAFSQASGVVYNDSEFDFDQVKINIILFDKNGRIVGLNQTDMQTLLSKENRYFVTKWFYKIPEEVSSMEVEPETNIFKNDNFMRQYGVMEKFKEY